MARHGLYDGSEAICAHDGSKVLNPYSRPNIAVLVNYETFLCGVMNLQ